MGYGAVGEIRMHGLKELQRACKDSDKETRLGVRRKLREAGEPVRAEAERTGPLEISNLGPKWGQMRIGVTSSTVYVTPKARRRGGSPRPNLGRRLQTVMEDALEAKSADVESKLEEALDDIAERHW